MKVDLPTPGTPVMPTRRVGPARAQLVQQPLGGRPVVRPGRLDQGDGPGDPAPGRRPVPRPRTPSTSAAAHRGCGCPSRWVSSASRSSAASAITVPGREDGRRPGRAQRRRSPAAGSPRRRSTMMSGRPAAASSSRSAGTRVRCPAARVETPTMWTSASTACRATSRRRLEQRAHVDVEAEVGEGGGDHLLAAVVPVLAHLGHQDAGPAPLGGGELGGGVAYPLDVAVGPRPPRGTPRRWYGSVRRAARTPAPARPRSRRPWPCARAASTARASRLASGPGSAAAARVSAARAAAQAGSSRSARSRRSLATCSARTALLSTLQHVDRPRRRRPGTG